MTCKDAINSDTNSDDKKVYLLNEIRRSSKCVKYYLEDTAIIYENLGLEFPSNSNNYNSWNTKIHSKV